MFPAVEISDNVLDILEKSDRKMKYMEFDLKVERVRHTEKGSVYTVVPSRENSLDRLEEEGVDFPYEGDAVENSVIHQDELTRLRSAIRKLDPEERDLVEALFFRGMKTKYPATG